MENFGLLTFLNWLHQIATIAWIGGMVTNIFIIMPSLGKSLDPPMAGKLMGVLMNRFKIMVYLALVILFFTGFAISGLSPDYTTYYGIGEPGPNYFLIKHLITLVVIILTVVAFEMLAPKVAQLAAQGPSPKLARLQTIQKALAMFGFLCGLVIVLLSVMMKISH